MNDKKIYSLLGLCKRAGLLVSGEFKVRECVTSGKAQLVIVSRDASDRTKKLFKDKCRYYEVPVWCFGGREDLGRCIGNNERCTIGVLDKGFSDKLIDILKDQAADLGGSSYGESEGL